MIGSKEKVDEVEVGVVVLELNRTGSGPMINIVLVVPWMLANPLYRQYKLETRNLTVELT